MIGLTPREARCLKVIKDFQEREDISPTFREIQELMGYKTPSNPYHIVKQLEEKGMIRMAGKGRNRAIIVVKGKFEDIAFQNQITVLKSALREIRKIAGEHPATQKSVRINEIASKGLSVADEIARGINK